MKRFHNLSRSSRYRIRKLVQLANRNGAIPGTSSSDSDEEMRVDNPRQRRRILRVADGNTHLPNAEHHTDLEDNNSELSEASRANSSDEGENRAVLENNHNEADGVEEPVSGSDTSDTTDGVEGDGISFVMELRERFEALSNIDNKFGFLDGEKFNSLSVSELKERATNLANTYKSDLVLTELLLEVESFKFHALNVEPALKLAGPVQLLNFLYKNKFYASYPNLATALQIYLTLPVTSASFERTFSKLNLIKNLLRSAIAEDRLSNLSIISIEHERASIIKYDELIDVFAARKSRKVVL